MGGNQSANRDPLLTETCAEVSCSLRQSIANPLTAKHVDVLQATPEPLPEKSRNRRRKKARKRRRNKTDESKAESCSFAGGENKENQVERKWQNVLNEEAEPQQEERPRKRRRTETDAKEASCTFTRTESRKNPLQTRQTDVSHEEPELQPKMNLRKRRSADKVVERGKNPERILDAPGPLVRRQRESKENPESNSQTSSSFTRTESKESDRTGGLPEGPEPQSEETPEQRRRTETEKNDANMETEERTGTQSIRRINPFREAKFRGRYSLGELLGRGGFGAVFAGIRKADGRKVAVKIMLKQENELFLTLPGDTCSLPLEVALLKLVCEPPCSKYVVEMLEWFETPTSFILILERPDPCINLYMYCGGYYNRCLPESQAKIIMEQVVLAVCHCHARGVFHRDIKEENIILNPDTLDVKLIDFGCGDLIKNSPYTEFAGTPLFIPPEWFFDNEYNAEPATVWGLGVLLYSLLCGEPPYIDFFSITDGYYYLPENLPEIPCDLIRRCLEYDPLKRAELDEVIKHDWFYRSLEQA